MRTLAHIGTPLARLLGLAFAIAFAMALQIAAGWGVLQDFLFREEGVLILGSMSLLTFGCAAAILSTFTATLSFDPRRVTATAAFVALTLGTAISAGQKQSPWPVMAFFQVFAVVWVIYGFTSTYTAVAMLNVQRQVAWTTATGVAALFTFVSCVGFFARSWIGLDTLVRAVPLIRDLVSGLAWIIFFCTLAFHRPFRLEKDRLFSSLKLRLPAAKDQPLMRSAFFLFGAGILLNLFLDGIYLLEENDFLHGLALVPWSWFGLFFLTIGELGQLSSELRTGSISARLTPKAARRLLTRYEPGRENWAATVGIKTGSFIVDHDPVGYLAQSLPATIANIRADEIQKSVSKVLGGLELVNRSHGTRLIGALDAELSLRPCIDVLTMYACLYMDIGPLVERRINILGGLFPIIDPTLTTRINSDDLAQLMRRQEWLFYLDYAWTDQHLIASSALTRFDIGMSNIGLKERLRVIENLQKSGNIGAQVWVSPEARDRLLQEAPQLRTAITISPLDPSKGGEDILLFCIRFEHLIPMLQRYFELDTARRQLLDYEASQSHSRMLNLLSLQLSRATSVTEITDVLTSIGTVPWSGYKEKDAALHLILKSHSRLSDFLSPERPLYQAESREARSVYETIQETVEKVGYPSQLLHRAQMSKLALRHIPALLEAAGSPHNHRFVEAWLLLSSADFISVGPTPRKSIALFLGSLSKKKSLARNPLVQAKAVDAWTSLCRVAEPENLNICKDVLTSHWLWFIHARVGLDMMSHLIDAQIYAMGIHGDFMMLDPDLQTKVESYLHQEIQSLDPSHSLALAVMGRLQSIKYRKSAVA